MGFEIPVTLFKYDDDLDIWIYLDAADIDALDKHDNTPCGPQGEAPFWINENGWIHVLNSASTYDCWRGVGHTPLTTPKGIE